MHSRPNLNGHAAEWPEITVAAATGKAWALGLCSIAFALLGAAAVFLGGEPAWSKSWLGGWAVMILFPIFAVGWLRQAAVRGAVLSVGAQGVRDVRLSPVWIPWRAIADVSVRSAKGVPFLMLQLDPEFERTMTLSAAARLARPANALMGHRGLWISSIGLTAGFEEIRAAIEDGWTRARGG